MNSRAASRIVFCWPSGHHPGRADLRLGAETPRTRGVRGDIRLVDLPVGGRGQADHALSRIRRAPRQLELHGIRRPEAVE